jgi:hypothetical protein
MPRPGRLKPGTNFAGGWVGLGPVWIGTENNLWLFFMQLYTNNSILRKKFYKQLCCYPIINNVTEDLRLQTFIKESKDNLENNQQNALNSILL